VLQRVAVRCSCVLFALCSVLQCVAVCCSVLQCVAVRCSEMLSIRATRAAIPAVESHHVCQCGAL